MGPAIVFWLLAAVGACFNLSAQKSGEMRQSGGKRFSPLQQATPPILIRDENPSSFRDGLVMRWVAVGVVVAAGAGCAIATWLGVST